MAKLVIFNGFHHYYLPHLEFVFIYFVNLQDFISLNLPKSITPLNRNKLPQNTHN